MHFPLQVVEDANWLSLYTYRQDGIPPFWQKKLKRDLVGAIIQFVMIRNLYAMMARQKFGSKLIAKL